MFAPRNRATARLRNLVLVLVTWLRGYAVTRLRGKARAMFVPRNRAIVRLRNLVLVPMTRLRGHAVTRLRGKARAMFAPRNRATARLRNLVFVLVVLMLAQPLFACPACYGAPGDPMVKGTNNGVWVLLGVVGFVQTGFVAMFWSFWRRARAQKKFRDQFHVIEGGPHP